MKYTAPDYETVSIKVSQTFANYLVTGCPPDESEASSMNSACEYNTLVSLGLEWMCYSSFNP